jgi:cobalt-zinc-cadmium efflux system outer membrane protein
MSAENLTADDAVAIALWNNPAFASDLAELGIARADLVAAGMLKNPILSLLFPVGPKQFEATLSVPVEGLWQRPKRVAAAKLEVERVASNLVQHGLALAGTVKTAFADLALAQEHAATAREASKVHAEIADIAMARLRSGDISQREAAVARAHAERADQDARRADGEVAIAMERFRSLLGVGSTDLTVTIRPPDGPLLPTADLPQLLEGAFAARPDLRAAELSLEAAGERAGWERSKILNLSLLIDANGDGSEGFEMGPGIALPLPIFDWNQGGTGRAEAELARAARRYADVRQTIAHEVREARIRLEMESALLAGWRERVQPALEEARRGAEQSYAAGEVSYLFVLETAADTLAGRQRESELRAGVSRALAGLEQSVGRNL